MRISVLYPAQPRSGNGIFPYADLVREGLADRLWMGTSIIAETHQQLAFLAGAGYRIPVGTSVTLTPLRHPFEAAVEARSLALLTERPVVAGFGASARTLVAYLLGSPYERPATVVGDYVRDVRAFLDGRDGALPAVEHPGVEVGAGVLRPGMARVAGAAADAAITWLTPPAYLSGTLIPALDEGAAEDRERPRVVTVVPTAVDRPGRSAVKLAYAAAARHLSLPHYVDMLRRAGTDVHADDPVAGAHRLVDDGNFLFGSRERIAAGLFAYACAGVDEVVVNTAGVHLTLGPKAAVEDAEEILRAVAGGC
ncbi:LLM class flavin-dependent oxidoreductase [Nocardiopsis aegyptia]|uniref:Alkanesulfonate monooxygenase SsuD/methylene tetrahydromethanopterin reductase-like flavin-dependent oxidoreductase (Luciferase family) n=1 Tax=Nocardiopsis aegyptia TaxID=220378 RepID=A0A7Z0JAY1_9ACTN|nr:LLM class flavin-dependent oxidoreductase [Nocardiopsis aegyptia]NYJ35611.1 alkanesulfonate monooxygenase SsuD/methylene tetrahydromethanopterin reductase-like flavin-dependent oxidoreductase (luciferase family) [Nocardiopsis aegyptia]